MKLVLLFGDCAVGKMTVGQELAKITDLRLFHNHMTIEPVLEIFGTYEPAVIEKLRQTVFESFVKTDHYGLIFTFMWAFDCREDWAQTAQIADLFQRHGAEVYYVELVRPRKCACSATPRRTGCGTNRLSEISPSPTGCCSGTTAIIEWSATPASCPLPTIGKSTTPTCLLPLSPRRPKRGLTCNKKPPIIGGFLLCYSS